MMEKYERLEAFLAARIAEIYPEPPGEPHLSITKQMIDRLVNYHGLKAGQRVLDVGCGQGLALECFRNLGLSPVGLTFGEDLKVCRDKGFEAHEMDQSFLGFEDNSFDVIWCRHCLEHSVFPFFTLSQFFRVLQPGGLLYVEVPAPDTACHHERNRNHYSVLGKSMWAELMERSGFIHEEDLDINFEVPAGSDLYWAFVLKKPNVS